jgi:nitrite reductase/ring-hydroxylating ferredoxin subunit/uncharacterized membrane protein
MNPEFNSDALLRSWSKNRRLAQLAEVIQPVVRSLFERDDASRRALKNLLHGTFLGHPLHPPLTDIPIGAWTVAATCDALELCGVEGYRDAADLAIAVGAVGAAGAAITGLADWSDTTDEPQRLGMLHAILNTTALSSYVVSTIARRTGGRRIGIATAFAGYSLMTAAAFLGGELSFGMQLGVKHTAIPVDRPQDFTRVLDESALTENAMHAAAVETIPLLVTRIAGTVRAVQGACTHRGAPLIEGVQEDACVRCPWHGSRFSLEDGSVLEGPATFALATFETQVTDGAVAVRRAS